MSSAQLEKFALVKPAEIEWLDGLPFSIEFNDVYFSIHGAIEESQHVFIEGNNLLEDWTNSSQNKFLLAELGFGSGLNFLIAAHMWQRFLFDSKFNNAKQLHYIAIEKSPFAFDDLIRACQCWPEFDQISQQLMDRYPSQTFGRHQIFFPEFQLTLTLMFMPVEQALSDLITESKNSEYKVKVDHWFLDGFAPAKNASMWSEENAVKLAKLSKVGTRLASYSVAGSVKRALSKAGFEISKRKGFAKKREMLTAIYKNNYAANQDSKFVNIKFEKPWFSLTSNFSENGNNRIAIIGAGIAGCATAFALAKTGIGCDIFDANEKLAGGASGAAAGIFHPQLTADMNHSSQFSWLSYLRLIRFLSSLKDDDLSKIVLCQGVYRILEDQSQVTAIEELCKNLSLNYWIKSAKLADQTKVLHFPHSAALNIPALCQLFISKLDTLNSKLRLSTKIESVEVNHSKYQLTFSDQKESYDHIIYCGGANSHLLSQLAIKNTNTTRGQSCFFESSSMAKEIKSVLCEKIYLVPGENDQFHLGATFEDFSDPSLNSISQTKLLEQLSGLLNKYHYTPFEQGHEKQPMKIQSIPLKGTVGYRLHSSDRMPLVGGIYDHPKMETDFKKLGQRRLRRQNLSHYNLPGLWINSAYGSHGILYALLASEHLVSQITSHVSPLSTELSNALNPARFLIRNLKQ